MRKVISIMLAIIMGIIVMMSGVFAHPETSKPEALTKTAPNQFTAVKTKSLILSLEKYLIKNEDGTIKLEIPVNERERLQVPEGIELGLESTNRMIQNGYLSCNNEFKLTKTDKYQDFLKTNNVSETVTYRRGVTKIKNYWWGYDIYLSNKHTKLMKNSYGAAGVLAVVIPDPTLCKAVAIACGSAYFIIDSANKGNGVIISVSKLVPMIQIIPFNIRGQ